MNCRVCKTSTGPFGRSTKSPSGFMGICALCKLKKRFNAKVNETVEGCWLWTGARGRDGYGHIKIGSTMVGAHRVAYVFARGTIPEGLHVMHTCDVKICVNPAHLRVGTHRDNMADKVAKGRTWHPPQGAANPASKLSIEQVREIRESSKPLKFFAAKFGIGTSTAHRARRGETYKCT